MKESVRRGHLGPLWQVALFLPLTLVAGGCSDGGQDSADASGDAAGDAPSEADGGLTPEAGLDARPDVAVPDDGGDGGDVTCVPSAVWHTGDDGFTSSDIGGFVAQPPPDAGCSMVGAVYDFSTSAKTLSQHACQFSGPTDRTVHLTDAQALAIVTKVDGLQTSCPPYSCGADFGNQSLSVHHAGSASSTLYNGDFYAGCAGTPSAGPPFIAFAVLVDLENLLHTIAAAACDGTDAGDAGGGEAGTCVQGTTDAGSTDGGGAD
jgi:hypothetical protein